MRACEVMAGRMEVERALLARGAVVMTLRSIVDADMVDRVRRILRLVSR